MAKKRAIGRYPKAFRKMAVERLKGCDNIVVLAEELGVHGRLLYKWRDQLEPIEDGQGPPENSKERELRLQVAQLKRLVADKTLEADFFKGVPDGPLGPPIGMKMLSTSQVVWALARTVRVV